MKQILTRDWISIILFSLMTFGSKISMALCDVHVVRWSLGVLPMHWVSYYT